MNLNQITKEKIMENKPIKPPLGIIPKRLHDERRAAALMAACVRYYDAFLPVPFDWIVELHAILGDQIEGR